jgi:hypothetical protein
MVVERFAERRRICDFVIARAINGHSDDPAIQSALNGQKALPFAFVGMLHLRPNVSYDEELIDPNV